MNYFGDFNDGDIVYIPFNTYDSNGASVTVTNLANTDIHVHKNGNVVQQSVNASESVIIDFDGITGNHVVIIDTGGSADASFYEAGNDYQVRIEGVTVATQTLNVWIGSFSIENRFMRGTDAGGEMNLADNAITAAKYDESTAFPVKSDDSGSTEIARTGADGDTLETLSDQLDGIEGDISGIANTGAAINIPVDTAPNGFVITTGAGEVNDEDSTQALDGTEHQISDSAGTLDVHYLFDIGGVNVPVSVTLTGRVNSANDSLDVFVNTNTQASPTWSQRGILSGKGASGNDTVSFTLFSTDLMIGADAGKVAFRFQNTGLTTATLSIDQIFCSVSSIADPTGYTNGCIYIDADTANTNTVPDVDGTARKKVSTWAAALTLNSSLNFDKFCIANGTLITLTGNSDNFTLLGEAWNLDINGQSIEGASFENARSIIGIGTAIVTRPVFKDCYFGAVTIPPSIIERCGIGLASGTFTAGSAGDYDFYGCFSLVPGSPVPNFAFSGLGSTTNINSRAWSGGSSWTLDSNCVISHEVIVGGGQTFITSGADIEVRGTCRSLTVTFSTGGTTPTIQFAGLTGPITLSGTSAASTIVNLYGVSSSLADTSVNTIVTDNTVSWTDVDATLTDTNEMQGKLPDNNIMGSFVKTDKDDEIDSIKVTTDILNGMITEDSAGDNFTPAALQNAPVFDHLTNPVEIRATGGTAGKNAEELVDDISDEPFTAITHNVPTSFARRLRQIDISITSDTAQGSGIGNNQIQLATGEPAIDGMFDPAVIYIAEGTGAGQSRNIFQYEGSTRTATVDRDWKVLPDATSVYVILADAGREHVNEGLAQAGTTNTITLNTLASSSNTAYKNQYLFIRSGTGQDQVRRVKAYNGTTKVATVSRNWDIVPDTTSAYAMLPFACVEVQAMVDTELDTKVGSNFDAFHQNAGNDTTEVVDNIGLIQAVTDILNGMINQDSAGDNFTIAALQNAPSGSGGDATEAKQDIILTRMGIPVGLDGGSATLSGNLTKIADDNDGADYDAETDSLNKGGAGLTAQQVVDALMAHTGFTTGGTMSYEILMKILAAWTSGNWRDKAGSSTIKELLDADDGVTVILEATFSTTTPARIVTVQ